MPQGAENQGLEEAFKALEQFKRGDDPAALAPIEEAVRGVHRNAAARAALEQRLATHLAAPLSHDARRFICRELAAIGSAVSVPALAPLLVDDDLSYMARYALERIPGPQADEALRNALGKATGLTKVGIIHSVGVRRDAGSVAALARVLAEDPSGAAAAAKALGEIGTPEAARALESFRGEGTGELRLAIADGLLISAERLIASGERAHAVKLLEGLSAASQPPHVREAASRALSAATRP